MIIRCPGWWASWYPPECARGHPWGPGLIAVSWMPCWCAFAVEQGARGAGHLRVSCRSPGCDSVWFRPRHDEAPRQL